MASLSSIMQSYKPKPLASSSASYEQAKLQILDYTGDLQNKEIYCQFNPAEFTITKSVQWSSAKGELGEGCKKKATPMRNAPIQEYAGGEAAHFGLDLIFDTTQETSSNEKDVRKYTNALLQLTMMNAGTKKSSESPGAPPRVQFVWGSITLFIAVVEKITIQFTMFLPNGTPVRAKATVDFVQQDPGDDEAHAQNPTSRTEARKTRIVQMGERLDLIAYEEYGHPSYWRTLADANHLTDPRQLQSGQILVVPSIQ